MGELEPEPSSNACNRHGVRGASLLATTAGLLAITAGSLLLGCGSTAPEQAAAGTATVVHVVDGDTVDLEIGGSIERVRLLGIDTPESVSRQTPVQCFGAEATSALEGLLPPETSLNIERDIEAHDRYGRLLLYVYRSIDGLFINEWMVRAGFANAVSYPPNDRLDARFGRSEALARQAGDGLWSQCDGPDQPLE